MSNKITKNELHETLKTKLDEIGLLSGLQTSEQGNLVGAINEVQQEVVAHQADDTAHVTAEERAAWNAKETTDGVRKKIEQKSYQVYKISKDANGVFTEVQYHRKDTATIAIKSVLSGGTSPQYTTRTLTFYGLDGVTVEDTKTFTLSYDADGELVSEV